MRNLTTKPARVKTFAVPWKEFTKSYIYVGVQNNGEKSPMHQYFFEENATLRYFTEKRKTMPPVYAIARKTGQSVFLTEIKNKHTLEAVARKLTDLAVEHNFKVRAKERDRYRTDAGIEMGRGNIIDEGTAYALAPIRRSG